MLSKMDMRLDVSHNLQLPLTKSQVQECRLAIKNYELFRLYFHICMILTGAIIGYIVFTMYLPQSHFITKPLDTFDKFIGIMSVASVAAILNYFIQSLFEPVFLIEESRKLGYVDAKEWLSDLTIGEMEKMILISQSNEDVTCLLASINRQGRLPVHGELVQVARIQEMAVKETLASISVQ